MATHLGSGSAHIRDFKESVSNSCKSSSRPPNQREPRSLQTGGQQNSILSHFKAARPLGERPPVAPSLLSLFSQVLIPNGWN